jgi:hypothetical protein
MVEMVDLMTTSKESRTNNSLRAKWWMLIHHWLETLLQLKEWICWGCR